MIDSFNDAHKDKGVQIKMEVIPEEQYVTKVLAAAATGKAPDFGWGTAGQRAQWANDGVIVPLDDMATKAGLDLADFSEFSIEDVALSEVRQQAVHDPDGPHEPAARGQSRPRQGSRPRSGRTSRRTAPR